MGWSLLQGKYLIFLPRFPHRSKPSRYFEGHEFRYLRPDSTSGCQGLSNKPSNTSESKRVKFYVFSTWGTNGNKKFSWGPPCGKKQKNSLYYFQMCLMARLKALGILRWSLGSDIKLSDLRSSVMVLIDVSP